MVERYGDFVLYNPPFKAKTSLLWLGPLALLLLSLFVLRNYLRQQKNTNKTAVYDSADLAQARELLRQSKPVNHLSNPSMTKDN
jgi:cytochrome c-type biogenesis protein CcmH